MLIAPVSAFLMFSVAATLPLHGPDGDLEGSPAADESGASLADGTAGGWELSLTPYLWLYGLDGDLRIRGTEADFDLSFGDILDNLDIALMARVEAWNDRFGLYLDPSYGRLVTEGESSNADAEVETDLILIDFGAFYRFLDRRAENGRASRADVSLGGRYLYIKNELDSAMADRDRSNDFVDLTVGGRYGMDLTERLGFLVEADIGGFDLGSSSEFAWNTAALGSLRIGKSGRLLAGYRILDLDRDDGGSNGIDVQFSGPIIGYEFRL